MQQPFVGTTPKYGDAGIIDVANNQTGIPRTKRAKRAHGQSQLQYKASLSKQGSISCFHISCN